MNLRFLGRFLACCVVTIMLGLLSGCGGGGGGGGGGGNANIISESTSATVSATGGTVTHKSGAKIIFPPGALSADTVITITRTNAPDNNDVPQSLQKSVDGLFYRFEPAGLLLNKPATITIPYTSLPSGSSADGMYVSFFDGKNWIRRPVKSIDTAANALTFETNHFTYFNIKDSSGDTKDIKIKANASGNRQFDIFNCNNKVSIDFTMEGKSGITGSIPDTFKGQYNPANKINYKIQLKEKVPFHQAGNALVEDKILRTVQVYSRAFLELYEISENKYYFGTKSFEWVKIEKEITVNEVPDKFVDESYLYKYIGSYSDKQVEPYHLVPVNYVAVFDNTGAKIDSASIFFPENSFTSSTISDLENGYFFHPTKAQKVLDAFPSNLLESGKDYYFAIDAESDSNKVHYETDTFQSTLVCDVKSLPVPTVTISSPTSNRDYNTINAIAFSASATDSVGNDISSRLNWDIILNGCDSNLAGTGIGSSTGFSKELPAGNMFIRASVIDDYQRKAFECVPIVVTAPVNTPPVITSIPPTSVVANSLYRYDFTYSDADGDNPVFTLEGAPAGMVIYSTTKVITWTPGTADSRKSFTFYLVANDGRTGGITRQAITVAVTPEPNPQPYGRLNVYTSPAQTGEEVFLSCDATDPNNQNLTYNFSSLGGKVYDIDKNMAMFSSNLPGYYTVVCNVSDGENVVPISAGIEVNGQAVSGTGPTIPQNLVAWGNNVSIKVGTNSITVPAIELKWSPSVSTDSDSMAKYLGNMGTVPINTRYTSIQIYKDNNGAYLKEDTQYCASIYAQDSGGDNSDRTDPPVCASTPASSSLSAIRGKITIKGGGTSADVTLTATPGNKFTTSSTSGYTISGIPNGRYTVKPFKVGHYFYPPEITVDVNGADSTGVNFDQYQNTYNVTGRITYNGSGLLDVTVSTNGGTALTDAAGNFRIQGLVNDNYSVVPHKSGYVFTPEFLPARVNGDDVKNLSFTANVYIPPTYNISGVVTVGGNPLTGVTVTLAGSSSQSIITGPDGKYNFTDVQNGSYTLTATLSGYLFTPASQPIQINGSNGTQNFSGSNTGSITGSW